MQYNQVNEPSKILRANDVSQILQISRTSAYRIIKSINDELEKQGKIVIKGRVSARYFNEKVAL
jgi:predicted DNA-binding transcriptional regulator AlpA